MLGEGFGKGFIGLRQGVPPMLGMDFPLGFGATFGLNFGHFWGWAGNLSKMCPQAEKIKVAP